MRISNFSCLDFGKVCEIVQGKIGRQDEDFEKINTKVGKFKTAEECARWVYINKPRAKGAMMHDTHGEENDCFADFKNNGMTLEGKGGKSYYSCLYRGRIFTITHKVSCGIRIFC